MSKMNEFHILLYTLSFIIKPNMALKKYNAAHLGRLFP